jgi:predicted Zn-dependent protease
MTETVETLFDKGFERYRAGEDVDTLIPVFREISDRAPKNAAAWTSLAWLYLLADKPKSALRAAQKAVKCDPRAPQARVNLALALLETETKGVRQQIDVVAQMAALDSEIRQELTENIEDGLARKPDWKHLQRIKSWLFD